MTSLTELTIGRNQIFKTDSRGRVRVPEERREALLDEFERSGMACRAFAQLIGVHPTTFGGWHLRRRKARERGGAVVKKAEAPALRLLEAVAGTPQDAFGLRVELAGVARLEIHRGNQVALAAELITAVASRNRKVEEC